MRCLALAEGHAQRGGNPTFVTTGQAPALEARKITATSTESEYVAQTLTELPDDQADDVMKLVASLESDDDVQNVYSNLG